LEAGGAPPARAGRLTRPCRDHSPDKPRRRGGNPRFQPTDEQRRLTMILAAAGHTQAVIAARLGISTDTIQRHLAAEFAEGRGFANASIGEVLFKEAMKGDVKAIAEWFDRRGGDEWRKLTRSELSGPGGTPIRIAAVAPRQDLKVLTDEELEQLERLTAKMENHDGAGD
jgi:DNA-binding CsgD family transcriptional regulator